MSTKTVFNLGPNIPGMENEDDPFVLQEPEFYALQTYVDAGQRLPTNARELELVVGIPEQEGSQFSDILGTYGGVKEHCAYFATRTFPESVTLASDIVSYATKADVYYSELVAIAEEYQDADSEAEEQELERDFRALVERLRREAQKFVEHTEEISGLFGDFLQQTEDDERKLTPLYTKYRTRFDNETGQLAEVRREIEELGEELKAATREYEKAHYKAYKEPAYYGWLGPIGAGVAIAMLIKYGEIADKMKAKMKEIKRKIEAAQQKEQQAERFIENLDMANYSLHDIRSKLQEALPVIGKLRGCWKTLEDELNNIVAGIDTSFEDIIRRIVRAEVEVLIKDWERVATKADLYRLIAFIRVVPEEEIEDHISRMSNVA